MCNVLAQASATPPPPGSGRFPQWRARCLGIPFGRELTASRLQLTREPPSRFRRQAARNDGDPRRCTKASWASVAASAAANLANAAFVRWIGGCGPDSLIMCNYWRGGKARSDRKRPAVYIRKDCIDWFLSYAADEHLHQGIVDTAVAEDGAPEGNCPEVPGLRVEWNFSTKVWLAEFVSGPSAGKNTSLGPQDLTVADWAKMQAIGTPDAIGDLSSADQRQRKAVAKALCLVRLSDQSAVAEAFETPKKMRRQGDRETARLFETRA